MIDLVAADSERRLIEVPVGFKWFVDGLVDGSLGFGGEESAGASFLRRDGTRLDDRQGRDHRRPARLRADGADRATTRARRTRELTERFGVAPAYRRIDAPATPAAEGRARAS